MECAHPGHARFRPPVSLLRTNRGGHSGAPDEFFVVQLDGQVKSTHGRFFEALREALLLRDGCGPEKRVVFATTPAG
jgi:hypothetical protein